ncbi:rRNA-binding ribosome biosynthesis protein [Ophidiomyces ophidiicola]|uniref:rRNA-binding ribosome biosynthesis protein n=1 Tax=Ophidiomyces ophidiicola TaxID=1387563 RepID=A0ACB8V5R6_9EURO|nr:rRNA-binding ribosome biosynthesis protein [Ophidiomyces ophidiicola]KAI1911601.1 rRNA-binding ribosome biosynthesis protein [Ophidiomyces ophidiicola]KAI1911790.1 rRNA-binding ribosome biosynthesis protein [Ophidiomyces ophidiicola]KAI1928430.1 rRNA-binding ribosome biosynthesis protein [Ophidiomyces ophidiicola]KAI1939768.1 rRNA-binding ribosome biosynthesis protein [Ophidiomyces ophidiicola]KAI1956166.1 rRNA-binding ribosome biosynthesis protein [Ophidiomyces ophidiicola]
MAKRRTKKRTHANAAPQNGNSSAKIGLASQVRTPKSMVIRMGAGEVGPSVSQLVKDVRSMMEPDTASRLRERRGNKLKDYTVMTGPLGITHLFLFSKSSTGNTNLRIALTPRGPTLHFRVEKYSLCKDIAKSQKHPTMSSKSHRNPPLLVMNNFTTSKPEEESTSKKIPKHLESLTTTVFQSLFPPISPQTTPLSSIRRIMLLNRELSTSSNDIDEDSYILNLRHYAITTKRVDVSKRIRRLDPREQRRKDKKDRNVPNLGKLNDVADYLLDPSAAGYTSASETEVDTDAEVEIMENKTRKVLNKKELQRVKAGERKSNHKSSSNVEKRAVKLVEIGPRMRLRLMKVEEGLCGGRVMWHALVDKTQAEADELEKTWEQRRQEKELRKKTQKENVEKKKKTKAKEGETEKDEDRMDVDDDSEMWDSDDFSEDEGDDVN